jgi:threonine/homoserine/homoserine lactone efflux protein
LLDPALYLAFIAAVIVLVIMPGPNVALIVANSLAHGPKYGLLTVMGTSSAMIVQLALTVLGMATVLSSVADWFHWLRWIGVAYLVYLGVRAWFAPADAGEMPAEPKSVAEIYFRGFLVSLTNPKTLLFYAAFLPQFVISTVSPINQLIVLAVTFLMIAASLDSLWALLAGRLRPLLGTKAVIRNRLTGGLLIVAGLGLALARRS